MDLSTFFRDLLAPILGLIGFAQLWILKLWDRYVSTPVLEIHPSGKIEIGFSPFGPTVALFGTLRAKNKPVFVKEMRAIVVRQKDNSKLNLSWRAFRANQVTIDPQHQQTHALEIASSFMVRPESPHKYNVFLDGSEFQEALQSEVQPLKVKWKQFTNEILGAIDDNPIAQISKFTQNPIVQEKIFEQFQSLGRAKQFVGKVNEYFFWKPGEYTIKFIVDSDADPSAISKEWWVEVSEEDARLLRQNSELVVKELCNFTTTYNFVYKPYQEPAERLVED